MCYHSLMNIITDLKEIQHLAVERHDEFDVMRYMLELNDDISDEQIDALVDSVAVPIVAAINCTQCGNCCRSLEVCLVPSDAERLAQGLDIPLEAIMTHYIDREAGEKLEEWGVFKQRPCALLRGNLCSVYAHRPDSCRMYPQFTPDFRWTLEHTIAGAGLCPIIYNVLNAMVPLVDAL
jgi:uncharacterized protein